MLKVIRETFGPLDTYSHLLADPGSREAFLVDPGWGSFEGWRSLVEKERFALKAILNTHGHIDHTCDNALWKDAFPGARLGIHKSDALMLEDADLSGAAWLDFPFRPTAADFYLETGLGLALGEVKFRILATPGHTPGGVCLLAENNLIAGDTLFKGGVGRWDLPGGNYDDLMTSIKRELLVLSDDTNVLPGHGEPTTIGRERKYNPFISATERKP